MDKNREVRKIQEIKNHEKRQINCYILLGDFNARILPEEGLKNRNVGKHFMKTEREREITETNWEVWDFRQFVKFILI